VSSLSVAIYAPSGFAQDPSALDRAVTCLAALGCNVHVDASALARHTRFAGTDDERLAAILRIAAMPGVNVALALRGGYGWTRLLPRLDFRALAASGKRWIGHSDFTAFQLAMLAATGRVTYAGPMATYDFGAVTPSDFTIGHALAMLARGADEASFDTEGPDVDAEGTLWGGNLTMIASLVGTPYMPRVDGGLLFVEDVSEHPYRVERMLHQLHYAGILARQRAILVGAFTGYELAPQDNGYDLDAALAHLRDVCRVPIVTGLPFGHVRDKLTLPVGGRARLAVRGGAARLAMEDGR